MEVFVFVIVVLSVSALCGICGYVYAQRQGVEVVEQQKHDHDLAIEHLKKEYAAQLSSANEDHKREVAEIKEEASRDKEELRNEHKEQLQSQKEQLDKQMKLFQDSMDLKTQEVLKNREIELQKSNEMQMSQIVMPLREQIDHLNQQLSDTKKDAAVKEAKFEEILNGFVNQATSMGAATDKLAQAMMSNSKVHGDWGEHVLEQILESSGLKKDLHYKIQQSSVDQEGNVYRPDVYVMCPGNRQIVVDSKVSLKAFANYVSAKTLDEAKQFEVENYKSMKNQVDMLAKKDYGNLDKKNYKTVLMFVPNEGAYILAMRHDPMLGQYAYDKGVVILTSTNLLLTLQLIEGMWQKENEEKRISEIISTAGSLFEKFVSFSDKMAAIKKNLDSASSAFEDAATYLNTGKGNIVRQIEKLSELGAKYNKSKKINSILASDESGLLEESNPVNAELFIASKAV